MKRLLLLAVVLSTGCSAQAAPTAQAPAPSPSPCVAVHPTVSGPVPAGPGSLPFTFKLVGGSYHRIPTSVASPAHVQVQLTAAKFVRLDKVEAVVVRRGVDITNGPFARHISMARDIPADGRTFDVTIPATDESGTALPPGQYEWGVKATYRETAKDTCGREAVSDPEVHGTGLEMPFLIVR